MAYPLYLEIFKEAGRAFLIELYPCVGMVYHEHGSDEPSFYEAKSAEELLVFLMGVYGWYPEGWDGEDITWGG